MGRCDPDGMTLRDANLDRLRDGLFDVLVIGAGINGAVSAAALAGRGASVAMVDRGDFGSFTSQESSNLVWGGFKYLENYELPLVFGLCRSRNRLMKAYPDNIKEIGFLAALDETAPYPPWFAALGAAGYWMIGLFGTKPPKLFDAERIKVEEPAIDTTSVRGGIQYQDAYLIDNDSRFVFSFVRSAIEAGACVANYVELVSAERVEGRWVARLRDVDSGEEFTTSARTIVNAAGPVVDEINRDWKLQTEHRIVYSKGIHLVVPRLTTNRHDRVLAFFDDTQRLFYVIPMGRRSVIGTTDTRIDTPFTAVDNDARFVFSFVRAAIEAGAAAANYVELVSARRADDRWVATLRDVDTGEEFTTTATSIVNAAGPFVDALNQQWGVSTKHRIVYSKGIHLVVPRLTTRHHHRVLAFFDDTQRLFYVIPMGRRSVIGTTDTRVDLSLIHI